MKILVCGGREYQDNVGLFQKLDCIAETENPTHIVHGAARGADAFAGEWARSRGVQEVVCPANWGVHGKSAVARRNALMRDLLDPRTDIVVGFPGGVGTAMMLDMAEKAGVRVIRCE